MKVGSRVRVISLNKFEAALGRGPKIGDVGVIREIIGEDVGILSNTGFIDFPNNKNWFFGLEHVQEVTE